MKKRIWKAYVFWIVFTEAIGALSGWLTREGIAFYQAVVRQPPLSPPGIVFPIVWTILYALMGIGAARVSLAPASGSRSRALLLYLVQLAFNFSWSFLFFQFQNFGFALIWLLALWALILRMIHVFSEVSISAARLQLPYLLWVTFAAYLNFGVWRLNR